MINFFKAKPQDSTPAAAGALKSLSRRLPIPSRPSVKPQGKETNLTFKELRERLHIPINSATPDQIKSEAVRERGLFLARQERWPELIEMIEHHDRARDATPAGTHLSELLLLGGRLDVVRAAEHALLHGRPAPDSDFFSGVELIEMTLMEVPESYAMALTVAHMHIDIGWAWRGVGPGSMVREVNREAFEAHFARAADVLAPFCATELDSPALAAARCALLPGSPDPSRNLVPDFEALIALDPTNPRHMRAFGSYLLPRWYGDFQKLDLEARRAAASTHDVWGAGAYAWIWFDALLLDPSGFMTLEVEYLLDGINDILAREPSQHVANLMAAHLFRSWQTARQQYHESGVRPDLAPTLRRGFEQIVKEHLREVHPLIWGQAEIGFENATRIISSERLASKGCEVALNAVAMPFLPGLRNGQTIQFSDEGITQINP